MRSRSAVLLYAAVCFIATPATADVVIEHKYPVKGEATAIRVLDENGTPVSGAELEVTYRPGSSVARTEPIGRSATGAVEWTPQEAGIATITATWVGSDLAEASSTTNVSVKFRSPPIGGILIMIVAGLLLVVGSVIRVANLLRAPQAP